MLHRLECFGEAKESYFGIADKDCMAEAAADYTMRSELVVLVVRKVWNLVVEAVGRMAWSVVEVHMTSYFADRKRKLVVETTRRRMAVDWDTRYSVGQDSCGYSHPAVACCATDGPAVDQVVP